MFPRINSYWKNDSMYFILQNQLYESYAKIDGSKYFINVRYTQFAHYWKDL